MRAGSIMSFARVLACGPRAEPFGESCEALSPAGLTQGCTSDGDCLERCGATHDCDLRTATCLLETRACKQDFECCAGQSCAPDETCVDAVTPCDSDAACVVPGQACRRVGWGMPETFGCLFAPCAVDATCGEGLQCSAGYCVGVEPCDGGCPVKQVCVPSSNRCFDVGEGTGNDPAAEVQQNRWNASCRQSCDEGSLLVLNSPFNAFNRCDRNLNDCRCQPKLF